MLTLNLIEILNLRRIICILALSLVALSGEAQHAGITLKCDGAYLGDILKNISNQTGYRLQWVGTIGRLRVKSIATLQNAGIREALTKIIESVETPDDRKLTWDITKDSMIVVWYIDEPIEIKGRILNQNNEPLASASIQIQRTSFTVLADSLGYFLLKASDLSSKDSLVITHVDCQGAIYAVNKFPPIIKLHFSEKTMDEVVYSFLSVKYPKRNSPNPVQTSTSPANEKPESNSEQAQNVLKGLTNKFSGLLVQETTGIPGAAFTVRVRGDITMDKSVSGSDLVVMIDGAPFEPGIGAINQLLSPSGGGKQNNGVGPFSCFNPLDIESVSLLKGAAATSLYGARGGNGVIEIITKKGLTGKARWSINLLSGFKQVSNMMKLAPLAEFLEAREEGFRNDSIIKTIRNARDVLEWKNISQQNMAGLMFEKLAPFNSMYLNCSGGQSTFQYYFALGLDKENAVFGRGLYNNRGTFRANLRQTTANGNFEWLLNTYLARDEIRTTQYDLTRYILQPPNFPFYDSAGNFYFSDFNSYLNPEALALRRYNFINDYGTVNLRINAKLLPDLHLRTVVALSRLAVEEIATNPSLSNFPGLGVNGSAAYSNTLVNSTYLQALATYVLRINDLDLRFMLGTIFQQRGTTTQASFGHRYLNDHWLTDIRKADSFDIYGSIRSQYKYAAGLSSVMLTLSKKYILQVAARADASSRTAPEINSAFCPSLSLAWILSDEKWMNRCKRSEKDSLRKSVLSFLKIYLSAGRTANDMPGDRWFEGSWSEDISMNGVITYLPQTPYNPSYTWERRHEIEAAAEVSFFDDRLTMLVAVYRSVATSLLMRMRLLDQTGYKSMIGNTNVKVLNRGMELTIGFKSKPGKKWYWNWSMNLTLPNNRLISLPSSVEEEYPGRFEVGRSINSYRAYRWLGVNPEDGSGIFADEDKDGKFPSSGDALFRGDFDYKLYGGARFELVWKRWSFATDLYYRVQQGKNYLAFIGATPPGRPFNQPARMENRWRKPGDIAEFMRATTRQSGPMADNWRWLSQSTAAYSDASFLRCQSITFGYLLDFKKTGMEWLRSARLFVNAKNLFTITGYAGHDPETQDLFRLPPLRSVEAGIGLRI